MEKTLSYKIPEKEYSATLYAIREKWKVEAVRDEKDSFNIWDTFDWKIINSGYILTETDEKFTLSNEAQPLFFEPVENSGSALWAHNFTGAGLSELLSKLIKNRAMIFQKSVTIEKHSYNVLNDDSKIILHLYIKEFHHKDYPSLRYLELESLRGYDDETKEFGKYLESIACQKEQGPFQEKILGTNIDALYSSKMNLDVNPKRDTQSAACHIINYMINRASENIDGTRKDIDIEFLHDFRVYIRRLRSFISQIKFVFPDTITNEMKKDFASIGVYTGPVRDLDVYLEDKDYFISMLPLEMRRGLERFFEILANSRAKEFVKLKEYLDSDEFTSILKKWKQFTDKTERYNEENSNRPIIDTANTFIVRRYKKIVKKINALHIHTDDVLMHDLRIDLKKLRYMLEMFVSLYDDKRVVKLIKELKKFQDFLGLLNDLAVQKETIRTYLGKIGGENDALLIAASVGGLIVKLDEKYDALKHKFIAALKEFERPESQKAYKEIFMKGGTQ